MSDISMLDLRANLTDIIGRAATGETFTVFRFGTPVAEIGPFDAGPLNTSDSTVTFDATEDKP